MDERGLQDTPAAAAKEPAAGGGDGRDHQLQGEAEADMAAGRWEAAAAKLEQLARRKATRRGWRRPLAILLGVVLTALAIGLIAAGLGHFGAESATDPFAASPRGANDAGEASAIVAPAADATPEPRPVVAPTFDVPALVVAEPCADSSGKPLPPTSWLCRGHLVSGAAPPTLPATPAPVAAAVPAAQAQAPPFVTIGAQRISSKERVRYETTIVVPPEYRRDELILALAEATRQTLLIYREAQVVGTFAYSSAAQVARGYDKGRALASRDGRGWAGEGTFDAVVAGLVDRGQIYITLGTVRETREQVAVDQ